MGSRAGFESRLALMAFGFIAICAGSGCSGGPAESAEILIGEYGALTGSAATLGISTKNGIEMAQDRANRGGGVLGKKIRVIVEDDRGKPEEAQTVVSRLINRH